MPYLTLPPCSINHLCAEYITRLNFGRTLYHQLKYAEAESNLSQAVELATKLWGADSVAALEARGYLAVVRGQHASSEDVSNELEQVVAGLAVLCGPTDERTLLAMIALANQYETADRWQDSLDLHETVMQRSLAALGPDDDLTLSQIREVGRLYMLKGDLTKSHELLSKTLESCRAAFGKDDNRTLACEFSLGQVEKALGHHEAAIQMFGAGGKLGGARGTGPQRDAGCARRIGHHTETNGTTG